MLQETVPNLGIITAYNDMVSAHQPFKDFPDQIKDEAQKNGATAQVTGGTPAMCDGITQGYAGMELSLFSREVERIDLSANQQGCGRELFANFRSMTGTAQKPAP